MLLEASFNFVEEKGQKSLPLAVYFLLPLGDLWPSSVTLSILYHLTHQGNPLQMLDVNLILAGT